MYQWIISNKMKFILKFNLFQIPLLHINFYRYFECKFWIKMYYIIQKKNILEVPVRYIVRYVYLCWPLFVKRVMISFNNSWLNTKSRGEKKVRKFVENNVIYNKSRKRRIWKEGNYDHYFRTTPTNSIDEFVLYSFLV